jgi:hypothetical protein
VGCTFTDPLNGRLPVPGVMVISVASKTLQLNVLFSPETTSSEFAPKDSIVGRAASLVAL